LYFSVDDAMNSWIVKIGLGGLMARPEQQSLLVYLAPRK